jgi:divalent metal cation (Fe/Co/Zn/Cd) transporter
MKGCAVDPGMEQTSHRLYRRALRLEYATVGYNLAEAVASIIAGAMASSIALVGFGLDSVVESLSGMVLIWRLRLGGRVESGREERAERRAIRFVGVSFWILGVYVLVESVRKITGGETAAPSWFGVAIAAFSAVVMPVLGVQKYRLGRRLGLRSLVADAKETFTCFALSLALLAGLIANAVFGFGLADPLIGLMIAAFLFIEGRELLFEKEDVKEKEKGESNES